MRRIGLPVGVFVAGFLGVASAGSAQAETVVTISKSQQRLAVTVDGVELHRWPVSTGRPGLATPSGTFRPIRFERQWYSRKYDWSPMPYSVFFNGGYALHGTYETGRLGQAASHGCVRLLPVNAAALFSLLRQQGKGDTRIVVTDAALPAVRAAERENQAEIKVPLPAMHKPEFAALPEVKREATRNVTPLPRAIPHEPLRPAARVAHSRVEAGYASAGDEAAVLRGREAWLRSLDRKYGIAR
jgi:L,D-transpeptidase catalytic domain